MSIFPFLLQIWESFREIGLGFETPAAAALPDQPISPHPTVIAVAAGNDCNWERHRWHVNVSFRSLPVAV